MTFTRLRLTAALAATLASVAGVPASQADTCTVQVYAGTSEAQQPFVHLPPTEVETPPVTVPCPGPHDQPAPAPVWVTTESGPGYYNVFCYWIRIRRGGRIFFANTHDQPHGYRGTGFNSGPVDQFEAREVIGVSSLAVGYYKVYDVDGSWVADLYVDP